MEYHQTNPAFIVRPFTTGLLVFMHDTLGISYRASFFSLQFLLMWLCGPALARYLKDLGFSLKMTLIGMTIFYLSLPVFMAHFDPVYTWSDFWVYLMMPLSFSCLLRKNYLPAILAMSLALLTRETSLIFLPLWFFFIYRAENRRTVKPLVLTLTAVVLWLIIRLTLSGAATGNLEYRLAFNFDGFLRSSDTVFSLLVSLGMMWPIGFYQILRGAAADIAHYDLIRYGALVTAGGFIVSTLLFALARETRLFFPPFVFFLPLTLVFFQHHGYTLGRLMKRYRFWQVAVILSVIIGISLVLASLLFPEFEFRTWKDGNRILFGLNLAVTIGFFIIILSRPALPDGKNR